MENAPAEIEIDVGGETMTLTLEEIEKLLVFRVVETAKAKLLFERGEGEVAMNMDMLTRVGDINDMFFYLTIDAMERRSPPTTFKSLTDTLMLFCERMAKKTTSLVIALEWKVVEGMLFALQQMVMVKTGIGGTLTQVEEGDLKIIPEPISRKEWADGFKKTLKEVERVKKEEMR